MSATARTSAARSIDAPPVERASRDDPPLFPGYPGGLTPPPLAPGARFGAWTRHPRFGAVIEER